MEEYTINSDELYSLKLGEFSDLAFRKHSSEYGESGAKRIRENAKSIFESVIELRSKSLSNMLLVGRVQSGKTSNLEMLTAIAFDNGYNSVVIYGGYDTVLLNQTKKRFEKAFNVSDESKVYVFSTSESDELLNVDQDIIDTIVNVKNGKIIFVSMKRVKALSKLNSVLQSIDTALIKSFVIDDEGDQASLNTEFKKMSTSPTYNQIVQMKDLLNNPLYLSVTATPQALVFSPEMSLLRPDGSRLIHPGNGYTGADSFHFQEGNIIRIEDESKEIKKGLMPKSLFNAINYFLIASSIMGKRNIPFSDMIIHCAKEKEIHTSIFTNIDMYLSNFKQNIKSNPIDLEKRKDLFRSMFRNPNFFPPKITNNYDFDELWVDICKIVEKTYIVLQNSIGSLTMTNLDLRQHKIFIGGDLLQRGITFKHLVTTYFTRWPKTTGNMDTTLQRARWFGYRNPYLDLCKIFCTNDIASKYSRLAEVDNDLWDQFESIEKNELSIEDIIIDEKDTNLRPARANVVDIKTFSFRKKWLNQRIGTYNIEDIKLNDKQLQDIMNNHSFKSSNVGRLDNNPSVWYTELKKDDLLHFIDKTKVIFQNPPFGKQALKNAIGDEKIILELFWNPNEKDNYRTRIRSFYEGMKVSALQQGADTTDETKRKYLGDSHVIVDNEAITIQVFRIRPLINEIEDVTREQFMFSIHFPKPRKAYQWNG